MLARDRGWIPAGMLEAGEWLLKGDGGWVVIESVGFNGEVLSVFNFEVAEHHTYFVGEESWGFDLWTHNHNESLGDAERVKRFEQDLIDDELVRQEMKRRGYTDEQIREWWSKANDRTNKRLQRDSNASDTLPPWPEPWAQKPPILPPGQHPR